MPRSVLVVDGDASFPPALVVLISSDNDGANGLAAARAGASGFFPKDELAGSALRRLIEGR